jgi:hypothetical protein
MANLSVSVHGASFRVEDPSRVDRAVPHGPGFELGAYRHGGYPGPAAWVHAPIPIAAYWETVPISGHPIRLAEIDETVQLVEVGLDFDTSADEFLHVSNLHVWNGATRVAHFDGLSERGPEFGRVFEPRLELRGWTGLTLSVGVEFPFLTEGPVPETPAPAIWFAGAYAFVTVTPI